MKLAFDATLRNGKFGRYQRQRSKERSSKRKSEVFHCKRKVGVKAKSTVVPISFLKIEGIGHLFKRKTGERGQLEELGSD